MDKVPPVMNLKTRYTSFNCGACGKLIAREKPQCSRCGTQADWSKYIGVANDSKTMAKPSKET